MALGTPFGGAFGRVGDRQTGFSPSAPSPPGTPQMGPGGAIRAAAGFNQSMGAFRPDRAGNPMRTLRASPRPIRGPRAQRPFNPTAQSLNSGVAAPPGSAPIPSQFGARSVPQLPPFLMPAEVSQAVARLRPPGSLTSPGTSNTPSAPVADPTAPGGPLSLQALGLPQHLLSRLPLPALTTWNRGGGYG